MKNDNFWGKNNYLNPAREEGITLFINSKYK
jgi:hypothetical protein